MALTILNPNPALVWNGSLTTRSSTSHLIIHHAAGTGTVHAIHNSHINKGWVGIAYNFYIRTDGSVYQGRGWDKCGGHTLPQDGITYNNVSIGICCEGDYHTTSSTMPIVQLRSLVELIAEAKRRYPSIYAYGGHNDYNTGNQATACPGQYFPKATAINGGKQYASVVSAADTLTSKGVINSPTYWVDNFFRVEYLANLIINMAAKCKGYQTGLYHFVSEACHRLAQAGIIDTPDYWIMHANDMLYLSDLLINAANRA